MTREEILRRAGDRSFLDLRTCAVADAELMHLAELTNLIRLYLSLTKVTEL